MTDLTEIIRDAMDSVHDMDVTFDDYAKAAAEAVKGAIKPLVWEHSQLFKMSHSADYVIAEEYDDTGARVWVFGLRDALISEHETQDEAKAAADAHHRASILAAMGVTE